MKPPPPVYVIDLLPDERAVLLDLLSSLQHDEWDLPTVCDGWSVKDIAAHILADDIGQIARRRDEHAGPRRSSDGMPWDELVAAINAQNDEWVRATRRLSMPIIVDFLRLTGEQTQAIFETLDSEAPAPPVDWAGPQPTREWLQLAREYTERWAHQQQIRDALGKPGLRDRRFFGPVLETFARALPRAFRDTDAPDGTHVRMRISGEAGGTWSVVRDGGAWGLYVEVESASAASVTLDQDEAWRLYTKGITPQAARGWATIEGDAALAAKLLEAVAIIA